MPGDRKHKLAATLFACAANVWRQAKVNERELPKIVWTWTYKKQITWRVQVLLFLIRLNYLYGTKLKTILIRPKAKQEKWLLIFPLFSLCSLLFFLLSPQHLSSSQCFGLSPSTKSFPLSTFLPDAVVVVVAVVVVAAAASPVSVQSIDRSINS